MPYARKTCSVSGCTQKQAPKKEYCWRHAKEMKSKEGIPKETRAVMRSNCCDAVCTKGERHEYGEQYCEKCKNPCMWNMPKSTLPDLNSMTS